MLRKLMLAALALACVAVTLLLPYVALAAEIATASDKVVAFPYGDWIVAAGNEVSAILVPLLAAAIMWAIRSYVPVLGLFVQQSLVQRMVQNAIDYGTNAVDGAVKGQQLTVPVGSAVIAKATQRAVDQAPGWLLKAAGGPQGIAEKVFRVLHLEPGSTAANVLAPVIAALPAAR